MLEEYVIQGTDVKWRYFQEDADEQEGVKAYLLGERGGPDAVLCRHSNGAKARPHFHVGSQFQFIVRGTSRFPDKTLEGPAVHYSDHNTAYGPFEMDNGHEMLVLHPAPAGQVFLHQDPASFKKRANSSGRLMSRSAQEVEWEDVPGAAGVRRKQLLTAQDGPIVAIVECAAGATIPAEAAPYGRYEYVRAGSVVCQGKTLEEGALRFVRGKETPAALAAGGKGATVFLMAFDADAMLSETGGLSIEQRQNQFQEIKAMGQA